MNEQTINGTRVVFRDTIPAKFGWKLISPMNRLSTAFENARKEIRAQIDDPELAEDTQLIPIHQIAEIVGEVLSFEDIVRMVRGAVQEWDFEGDLSTDTCCDDLDTLDDLLPIVYRARTIYFRMNLSGE